MASPPRHAWSSHVQRLLEKNLLPTKEDGLAPQSPFRPRSARPVLMHLADVTSSNLAKADQGRCHPSSPSDGVAAL